MPKYRIISESGNGLKHITYHIERKGFFKWKPIVVNENGDKRITTFNSFGEAEYYLVKNYCGNSGTIYQPYPNEFHYTAHSYYY